MDIVVCVCRYIWIFYELDVDLVEPGKKELVSVEDILGFSVNDKKPTSLCNVGQSNKRVSVGVQTEPMVCLF
jgi:hypothetical protein